MEKWARKKLNFAPGTEWQYSNTNYTIAGAMIEKITGQPLMEFLRSRVFQPLEMKSPIDVDHRRGAQTIPGLHEICAGAAQGGTA